MASADVNASPSADMEGGMSPGEFVLKKLFAEFVVLSERKLKSLATQPLEHPLMKSLQRGEDAHFDQLLNALNEVASFCLRSLLASILKWRDMQIQQCRSTTSWSTVPSGDSSDSPSPANKREKEHLMERQELGVEFIFCLVLVEVLTKLSVHPVPESFIHSIEDLAFRHFKQQAALKDRTNTNPNIQNMKKIADLYAEVIGVLSQARFHSVRRRFFHEIRDPHHNSATLISIIEGLSFVRVKMFPVEETEQWFAFLQECATYFLECSREKIKNAMSMLLVEILLPVAAVINLEASLPVVKKFVNMLYNHCVEQAKRARHSSSYIPLVTALLAISESQFFLNHWHVFLMQTVLPGIRRGDSKVQRTAFEALYRLVWVYMVRIKGESNMTTFNRLRVIVEILFPRGQRGVQPKDMPLNIFVKLIQFVARERLEYCMSELVAELLNVGRAKTNINPERMIIGLRAFLVIADSLEKKEGDPPMPVNAGPLPSGGPPRVKTKFLSTTLTDETAKKIGIAQYYPYVRRALDGILRSLDQSIGRSLTATNPQMVGKSSEEVLSGVKPKLDLLKMCVAAIPRIIPEGMSREDLIDLLSRLTIHVDHELVRTAFTSLQGLITNFPSWRHDVARVFAQFILRDIPDSCPLVLDAALKMLIQFLSHWKSLLPGEIGKEDQSTADDDLSCVPSVEACALVMLCNYRSVTRRLSLVVLKEVRALREALPGERKPQSESTVMDVMDQVTPNIIRRYLSVLSVKERNELRVGHHTLNLTWLADRSACFLEHGGSRDSLRDAWTQCLAGLLEPQLLPEACPTAVHLAWPYAFHRMVKAYGVLDPGYVAHEKGDRPPSLKGRRPVITSVEMFLWRNYLIFLSCTAPPSSPQASLIGSVDSSVLEGSGRFSNQLNARNLFHKVVPLIRTEGEIREVAITALGLVHPHAFGDLVDELQPHIHDALDQKRGDNPRKKRRREALRTQITRVFSLTAEHGCFHQSTMARGERGEVAPVLLEFIEGIKNYLESETDRMMGFLQELRLHFTILVASIINSLPRGVARLRLFSAEMRYNLFYLFSNWCGLFGLMVTETEQEMRARNPRASALSYNSLLAMSALLCCGPVFHSKGLERESNLYRWLDNMLTSGEQRVQDLGRKTVQLLLENNMTSPVLLSWVIDQCYKAEAACAQLCFHALCNTFTTMSGYPCDMVTVLHVVLYKTADREPSTRERATQLLQVLDRRFFTAQDVGGRPELTGCLTAGAYSSAHVTLSTELSEANPELTLPIFCEMVHRFDKVPSSGQQHILQYMVPWLRNVELTDDSPAHPHTIVPSDSSVAATPPGECSNQVLGGSGWGSPEGTRVVLHNLLYITARYGDEHSKEVEHLWAALCTWPANIRTTLNYLARLTCVAGNMPLMLQQAKRIMVCLSRRQATAIVAELITELQSVELLSADLQVMDTPPFYQITSTQQRGIPIVMDTNVSLPEGMEGSRWAVAWRILVRRYEGRAVPLPMPPGKTYYASMRSMLRVPAKPAPLHRCNFALILLSELVLELGDVDWGPHLPLLLHVTLLGLDLLRPLVYEHSKKLLGHLVVVLACRGDKAAALQARFSQLDLALRSPSLAGSKEEVEVEGQPLSGGNLSQEAKDLITFISLRDAHRPPWPFADLSAHQLNPSGEVKELTMLVGKVLRVFSHTAPGPSDLLRDKWAKIALQWATGCSSHQYASQSFQVCRALQLPLSTSMFREVVTRLAESASDQNEDMQSYVLEIVLTLESAVDHLQQAEPRGPSRSPVKTDRKVSDLPPLPSELPETPLSPPPSADSGAGVRHRHTRGRSVTSKVDMMRPTSVRSPIRMSSQMSPVGSPQAIKESTPTHHKAATVTGTNVTDGPGFKTPFTLASIPSEGEKGRRGASIGSQPSRDSSRAPDLGRTQQSSGFKISPEHGHSQSQVVTGTPNVAITAAELKGSREARLRKSEEAVPLTPTAGSAETRQSKEVKAKEKESSSTATATAEPKLGKEPRPGKELKPVKELKLGKELKLKEADPRSRKSSEPPLSLQALFDPDISLSRQITKQTSADEVVHLKQSSYDGSHTRTPQGSPKHMRRMRSPAMPLIGSNIQRTPSHPHLNSATSSPQVAHFGLATSLPAGTLLRARSTQQIKAEADAEELSLKRRSYSGESGGNTDMQNVVVLVGAPKSVEGVGIEDSPSTKQVPSPEQQRAKVAVRETPSPGTRDATVVGSSDAKEGRERSTSAPKDPQALLETADILEPLQVPLLQSSPSKLPYSDLRRRNSTVTGGKREGTEPIRKSRPKSMIETSSFRSTTQHSVDVAKSGAPDLLAKLFWTAASLLESDFEMEYTMALRLLSKTLDQLELASSDTTEHLEALLGKLKWPQFPGVQGLLLKGLTLESTSDPSRQLLSRITLYSTTAIFDQTRYAGLPLNIMALMPVLVYHFEQPTEFCVSAVRNIQQACDRVELPSEDCKTKLLHMNRMLQMYCAREFTPGSDMWLAGICRYLNDAYTSVAARILTLLAELLDKGCALYHRPVLRLLYEYMRLQDPKSRETKQLTDTIVTAVTRHIKGPLWKEALDLLKLAVSNSASLVQPPTRGLPVDLGHFNQTLPGPTLQFSMDLRSGSSDLSMVQEPVTTCAWKKPQQCQRRARERLLSVLNAFVPVPVIMSSPSVVFTDEQALMGDKATLYSSTSDEAMSIPSVKDDQSSQPESQVYITAVGHEFNFLDNFEYHYDSSSESETPGPFSGSFKALHLEYREEDEEGEGEEGEDSSPATPLTGSHNSSLELDTEEEEEGGDIGPSPAVLGDDLERAPPIRTYSSEPAPLAVEPTSPCRASSPTPQQSPYGTSPPDDHPPELSEKSPSTEERSQGTEDTLERSHETEELSRDLESLDLSQPTEAESAPGLTLDITQDSLEGSLEQSYDQESDVPTDQREGPPGLLPEVLHEQPHEQPVVSHEQPEVSHEQPEVSHERPEVSQEQPEVSQEQPHEQPEVPHAQQLEQPEASREQPEISHEQPEASHEKPEASHEQPGISHEQPEALLEQLEASHEQIGASQERPRASREQLEASQEQPHEQPGISHEQPEALLEQLEASHEQIGASQEQPRASREQLEASQEQPHEQPGISHEQPEALLEQLEASHEQIGASQEQPRASREQLEASQEQPHEQPGISHEQLEASHEQPHEQPEASRDQPEVSFEQLEVSHEQPEISHEQPEASHEQLEVSHEQPEISHEHPEALHEHPEVSSRQKPDSEPVDSHEQTQPAHDQPETSHEQPEASHDQSKVAHEQLEAIHMIRPAIREQPEASREHPKVSHEQPEALHEQTGVSPEHPEGSHKQPDATDEHSQEVVEASHEQTEVSCEQPEASNEQPDTSYEKPEASHELPEGSPEELEASHELPEASDKQPETLLEQLGASVEEAPLKEPEAVAPEKPEGLQPEQPGERFNVWLKEHLSKDLSLEEGSREQTLELPPVIFFQMSPEQPIEQSVQPPDDKPEEPPQLRERPDNQPSEPWAETEGLDRPEDQESKEKPPDSGAEASCDTSRESPDEGKDIIDMGDEQGSSSLERETFELSNSLPAQELAMNIPLPQHQTWSEHTPEASRFLNIANDEIDEAWRDHVTLLGRHKSPRTAVHTYFIIHRLFSVIRQQFCSLTREACNYLGENHHTIAAHFLVTVELLLSQFELPRVYIDSEMLSHSNLLDQQVFLVLETHGNFASYMERRRALLKCLNHFKLALRQQSLATPLEEEPASLEPESPDQAALRLCRAVHRFHFQLLVLLGSYVKLLGILQPVLEHSGSADICRELTEAREHIEESVLAHSRGPSPPLALDEGAEREVEAMSIADSTRTLEDALGQKQGLRAVQLLHLMRKHWRGEESFGSSDEDDMDVLFYIYARYATDRQEGMVCLTCTEHNLSEVHTKLMAQNVSLHSLLEQADHSHDQSLDDLDSPLKSPVLETVGESSC